MDAWDGLVVGFVSAAVIAMGVSELRAPVRTWRWWGPPAIVLGWVTVVGTLASPLDELGQDGSLSAHIAQHVVLGDLAAPLLLLAISPALAGALARTYERLASPERRRGRTLTLAVSPVGAAALWTAATYIWLVPSVHRLAIPSGPIHGLDHASFLFFGLLVWLAALDFRRHAPVTSWETLTDALRTAGLPWWGRHVYAMTTRFALLPAILLVWLAPSGAYFLQGQLPPGGLSRHEDQVQAASLMLGFEMLLFGLALVLLFVFASVAEGRRRNPRQP